jgi:hypothetical protein
VSTLVAQDTGTVHVLKEHHAWQAEERLAADLEWIGGDEYVFSTGWRR